MDIDFSAFGVYFLIFGLIVLLVSERTLKSRLADSKYLTFNAICAVIFGILAILTIALRFSGNIENSVVIQKLVPLPLLGSDLMGFLYHEGFINERPPLKRLLPVTIGISALILYELLIIFNIAGLTDYIFIVYLYFFTFLFGAYIHFYMNDAYKAILKIWDFNAVKIDKISVDFFGLGEFTVSLAFLLEILQYTTSFSFLQMIILFIGMILIAGSIAILMKNKAKWGEILYYIPIPIHKILIYNDAGMLIYSKDVTIKKIKVSTIHHDNILITGALSAFSMFFKEILGRSERLKKIETSKYLFIFSEIPVNCGTLIIVTTGCNLFIEHSLTKFSALMTDDIREIIKNAELSSETDKKFNDIFIKAFPYLEIND